MQPERDFSLWLDRRDADALGSVFDAMGGKLLLLATHLAGPGQQAQDLVQSTFLAAMARGASWDRQRPLWPWLAAILQNELRMQQRRRRRRREVAIDDSVAADAVAAAAVVADPGSLAASQEVLGTVLAAIDALPLPYRQVLRLRLVHGLRPVDIARSLEVPVGTVRAQLHRGLEQLRGRLPAGVASMVGLLLAGDGALLAQVRQRVLETVAAPAVVAGAGQAIGLGGGLSMNAKTICSVVGGLIVLACLGLALGVPAWFVPAATPGAPVDLVRAEMPIETPSSPTDGQHGLQRESVDPVTEPAWPLTVTVRIVDGAPVPDAVVQVWTAPSGGTFWNRESRVFLREDVVTGATTSDGVFRTSLDTLLERPDLWLRTHWLWVEASWQHGRSRYELLTFPRMGEARAMAATIELRRSRGVIGRVVDTAGVPVARAAIGTILRDLLSAAEAKTDGDGSFFVELRDEAEDWPTHISIVDARLGTATVPVPPFVAQAAPVDLGTIVLATKDLVRGQVELGDGSALAGIQVKLQAIDASLGNDRLAIRRWLMKQRRQNEAVVLREGRAVIQGMQTNTQADGSFQFAGLDPANTYFVQLWLLNGSADAVVRPGDEPVRLRVEGQLLTLEVVDEQGNDMPGVRLNCEGYDPTSTRASWRKRPGFPETGQVCSNWPCYGDPEGRRVMLSPFGTTWRIGTVDDTVQPAFARHEVFAGVYRATCRLVLRAETRFGKLHIVAVDELGAPIRFGAALKALDRDLQHNDRRMVSPPEGWTWDLPAGQWQVRTLLGKEVIYIDTDEGYARGFHDEVVTIEDGRTTELKVVAKPAGLVAFRLHSTQPPDVAWRGLRIETDGREIALHAHDRERFAPRPSVRPVLPVLFLTKQALPPGKQRFCVQADGYQPAVCEVDVIADRLNTVRVEMLPR